MSDLIEYTLVRSNRKTLSVKITRDSAVRVLAPRRLAISAIEDFVKKSEGWIVEHLEKMQEQSRRFPELSAEEKKRAKKDALAYLTERTRYFSELTGLTPTAIRISSAKARFGSCSAKNSVSYSLYLMNYPKEAIDYVVLHELSHIRHKNHGRAFYELIAKYMPDYKERAKLLK